MPYKDKERQQKAQREYSRRRTLANKLLAIEILGGKCVRCSETNFKCLHFDHINPIFRIKGSNSGVTNARDIIKGVLSSKDIQLLCANCHAIKTYDEDRMLYSNYIK